MKKIIFCFFTILCIISSCISKSNTDTKKYKEYNSEYSEYKRIDDYIAYREVKMHGGHEYYLYYRLPGLRRPFAVEHKIDCKKCLDLFD
jgi:hypothetical protein